MADERQELNDLRRLAELEAKAAGISVEDFLAQDNGPITEPMNLGASFRQSAKDVVDENPEIADLAMRAATEVATTAAAGPVLRGAGMALGRVAPGAMKALTTSSGPVSRIAKGIGLEAVESGIGAGSGSLLFDYMQGKDVNLEEALTQATIGAAVGGGLRAITEIASPGLKKLFNLTSNSKRIEDDFIKGLKPSTKDFNEFLAAEPADEIIRRAVRKYDILDDVKSVDDLSVKLAKRVGGKDIKTGVRQSGELGASLGSLADEISKNPATTVRFSKVKSQIDSELENLVSSVRLTDEADKVRKIAVDDLDKLRKTIAAENLFPKSKAPIDSLDEALSSLSKKAQDAQSKIDEITNGVETSLFDTRGKVLKQQPSGNLKKLQQVRDDALAELEVIQAELRDPSVTFKTQFDIQKTFDKKAELIYKRKQGASTGAPDDKVAAKIAQGARAFLKDNALANSPDLGAQFVSLKEEFQTLEPLRKMVSAARRRAALNPKSADTISGDLIGKLRDVNPLGRGSTSTLSAPEFLQRGLVRTAREQAPNPLLPTAGFALKGRIARGVVGAGATPFVVDEFDKIASRNTVTQKMASALLLSQGLVSEEEFNDGIDFSKIDPQILTQVVDASKARVDGLYQVIKEYGKNSEQTELAFSQIARELNTGLSKLKSGIPGEIKIGKKIRLPASVDRARYSKALQADDTLDKSQKAKMRSSAHMGDVIDTPKAYSSSKVSPVKDDVVEADL